MISGGFPMNESENQMAKLLDRRLMKVEVLMAGQTKDIQDLASLAKEEAAHRGRFSNQVAVLGADVSHLTKDMVEVKEGGRWLTRRRARRKGAFMGKLLGGGGVLGAVAYILDWVLRRGGP